MAEFFRPSDDLQLDELTNATLMKLEQFRDRTATGELHKYSQTYYQVPSLHYLMALCLHSFF